MKSSLVVFLSGGVHVDICHSMSMMCVFVHVDLQFCMCVHERERESEGVGVGGRERVDNYYSELTVYRLDSELYGF